MTQQERADLRALAERRPVISSVHVLALLDALDAADPGLAPSAPEPIEATFDDDGNVRLPMTLVPPETLTSGLTEDAIWKFEVVNGRLRVTANGEPICDLGEQAEFLLRAPRTAGTDVSAMKGAAMTPTERAERIMAQWQRGPSHVFGAIVEAITEAVAEERERHSEWLLQIALRAQYILGICSGEKEMMAEAEAILSLVNAEIVSPPQRS